MPEKPLAEKIPGPISPEADFGNIFEEVNSERDSLEIEYENFKILMKKEKLNVLAALLDYANGKRKPLADIYKVHPELKRLSAEGQAEKNKKKAPPTYVGGAFLLFYVI